MPSASIPQDVKDFLATAKGEKAEALRKQYDIPVALIDSPVEFTWYLYSDKEGASELALRIFKAAGIKNPTSEMVDELCEKYDLMYTFYEVTVECLFDPNSGVTIKGLR